MLECKRCGSTKIVKSGTVRGKQRYLCKRCGCHFVEGDQREKSTATVSKALCTIFQALGASQYRTVGKYLNRDISLIHRWMNSISVKRKRRWRDCIHEFWSINSLFNEIKLGEVEDGNPMLMVDNVIDGLYIAVIVQKREKS